MQKFEESAEELRAELENCADAAELKHRYASLRKRLQAAASELREELTEVSDQCQQARYYTSGLYNDVARKLCLRGMNWQGTLQAAGASLQKLEQLLCRQQKLEKKLESAKKALTMLQERCKEKTGAPEFHPNPLARMNKQKPNEIKN